MKHTFKVGDRVRLLRLDGTEGPTTVVIHDLWGDDTSCRNASFLHSGMEHYTHTDLLKHVDDASPVVIPDGGEWFIARGSAMSWGRAQTIKGAVANMQRNGRSKSYVVHRVSKWTQVSDMGCLSYPEGLEPVEVAKVEKKAA